MQQAHKGLRAQPARPGHKEPKGHRERRATKAVRV